MKSPDLPEAFDVKLLAKRLRWARALSGNSAAEVACMTGMCRDTLHSAEVASGKEGVRLCNLFKLAQYYQISADYLLGLSNDKRISSVELEATPLGER